MPAPAPAVVDGHPTTDQGPLLGNPTIVILDEPTAALGTTQRVEVLNQIAKLRARGLGVVMISHNLEDV